MKIILLMKTVIKIFLSLMLGFSTYAQDTFSIIAVDPVTGEIGSAGASCVTGVGSSGIIDIITDIIPAVSYTHLTLPTIYSV